MPSVPSRRVLIKAIRDAEADLRIVGSTWQDDVPGWARLQVLDVANALLALLILIDSP